MAHPQLKPAGTWTYDDLLSLPDDGRRYEIIEGELYEMPSPNKAHATTIINLIALLLPIVARLRAQLYTAPFDVFVPGGNPVQPDLLVVLPESQTRVERRGVEGPPDLAIEVVSPSNRGRDLLLKRALYERAGVREYWLVDPGARSLEILRHEAGVFRSDGVVFLGGTAVSPVLGGAEFPLDLVFADVEPGDDA